MPVKVIELSLLTGVLQNYFYKWFYSTFLFMDKIFAKSATKNNDEDMKLTLFI